MKTKNVKMVLGIILITLFTMNWMYITPDKLKWGTLYNKFPVVKYKINPTMIGFNTGESNTIIDIIRSAGNLWSFQNGESHFQLSYNGKTSSTPAGYDQMGCTEEAKKAMREMDNIVYASNSEDSDCSGQACTYIWSCEGSSEILHFDMEINARDYEWDTGTNHGTREIPKKSYNLFTVVAKQFGQLLGLGHCASGDSEAVCQQNVAIQGTSNPTSDSLLYKFIEPEVIRTAMSADDKVGLQALYGTLTPDENIMKMEIKNFAENAQAFCIAPCENVNGETNQYQVSASEQLAWSKYLAQRATANLENNSAIKGLFLEFQKSYFRSNVTGISAEEYLQESIAHKEDYITAMPTEFLDLYIQTIYVDILNRERALSTLKYELDSTYYSFIDSERKVLMQLRRRIIDEKLQR